MCIRDRDTPVLMLTAKNARNDRVRGLQLGADDYLAKPFDRDELVLRVEAIIRRSMGVRTLNAFGFRGLTLDPNTRRAAVDGAPVVLKGKQYDVLEYLVSHEGQLVSKTQLFDRVWGFMNDTSSNVVEVYVSALRKVLKAVSYTHLDVYKRQGVPLVLAARLRRERGEQGHRGGFARERGGAGGGRSLQRGAAGLSLIHI